MLTIPNLPTQDAYVPALTLGPAPTTRMIKYVVANKAVFMRVWPQSKSGTIPAQTDELLVTPETNVITDAMGVQFRSALPGVPAQVVAQLLEPGDPTFGGGTPFSSTISSTGGISPGVSAVQIQHGGALIGTEPTVDFVDANGVLWTVADDPANTRVTVAAAKRHGVILTGPATAIANDGGWHRQTYNAETFDSDGYWNGGAPDQITIPAGLGGLYELAYSGNWSAGTTHAAGRFLRGGAALLGYATSVDVVSGGAAVLAGGAIANLAAGDTVQLEAFVQTVGVTLTTVAFAAVLIG